MSDLPWRRRRSPLFLVGTLGISVLAVGIIEGLAESTALISKVLSGALRDYFGKRKGLALLCSNSHRCRSPAWRVWSAIECW